MHSLHEALCSIYVKHIDFTVFLRGMSGVVKVGKAPACELEVSWSISGHSDQTYFL